MQQCPFCDAHLRLADLRHPNMWANYRVCPHCGQRFTVDRATKRRQVGALVVALAALVFTLLATALDPEWWVLAAPTCAVLVLIIYYGNRHVYLVPYRTRDDDV